MQGDQCWGKSGGGDVSGPGGKSYVNTWLSVGWGEGVSHIHAFQAIPLFRFILKNILGFPLSFILIRYLG